MVTMRPVIIFMTVCFFGVSMQSLKNSNYGNQVKPNKYLCIDAAFMEYIEHRHNTLVFPLGSRYFLSKHLGFPRLVVTRWASLRESVSKDTADGLLIFLEGVEEADLNGLTQLQGVKVPYSVAIFCLRDSICSAKIYLDTITRSLISAGLHYIAVNDLGLFDVYEYTTNGEGRCGIPQLVKRTQCTDGSKGKTILNISKNFNKCPLRVATWSFPLLTSLCTDTVENVTNLRCGQEGTIIDFFIEYINASYSGRLETFAGDVRRSVRDGRADLGYGELDIRLFEGIKYTNTHMPVVSTVVARQSTWSSELPSMKNFFIFLPTEWNGWIGMAITALWIIGTKRFIAYFRKSGILALLGILLGIPVPRQPIGLLNRMGFISVVIFGERCTRLYMANVIKVLTTNEQKVIRNLNDLENSKIRIIGLTKSRLHFKADYPRIYREFEPVSLKDYIPRYINLLIGNSTSLVAYVVEAANENVVQWTRVSALEDRLTWYSVAFALPNSSSLLPFANKFFPMVWESGLLKNTKSVHSRHQHSIKRVGSNQLLGFKTLTYNELETAFNFFTLGLTFGFCIFLIEICTAFMKKKESKVSCSGLEIRE